MMRTAYSVLFDFFPRYFSTSGRPLRKKKMIENGRKSDFPQAKIAPISLFDVPP